MQALTETDTAVTGTDMEVTGTDMVVTGIVDMAVTGMVDMAVTGAATDTVGTEIGTDMAVTGTGMEVARMVVTETGGALVVTETGELTMTHPGVMIVVKMTMAAMTEVALSLAVETFAMKTAIDLHIAIAIRATDRTGDPMAVIVLTATEVCVLYSLCSALLQACFQL